MKVSMASVASMEDWLTDAEAKLSRHYVWYRSCLQLADYTVKKQFSNLCTAMPTTTKQWTNSAPPALASRHAVAAAAAAFQWSARDDISHCRKHDEFFSHLEIICKPVFANSPNNDSNLRGIVTVPHNFILRHIIFVSRV